MKEKPVENPPELSEEDEAILDDIWDNIDDESSDE